MKHPFCFLLSIMLLVSVAPASFASSNKKALIIGIGAYKPGNGWNTLHGDADVDLMESSLLKTGFDLTHIVTLKNNSATKSGVVNAMNTLLNECQPGDIVVFHFSGHGQQIQDMNGDEADGLDEALIPYDAPATNISGSYNGSLHLTDDELGVWFDKVRARIGAAGQLIVFLDACHSGTASRGNTIVRGGVPLLLLSPLTFKSKPGESEQNQSGYSEPGSARGEYNKGKFILFAAAQADKPDYEYENKIGSLTYALADAFNNKIQSSNLSFRDLYELVRNTLAIIVPYQDPELEGDKDVTIFSGDVVTQEPYFYVRKVRDKEITISGGTLLQVDKGAVIGFYKAGTRSKKTDVPLVTGKVVKATTFEAIVLLDIPYNPDSIAQCRAMVMQEGSKDRRTRIYISNNLSSSVYQKLTDALSFVKQVSVAGSKANADLIITDTTVADADMIRIASAGENTDLVSPVDMAKPALLYKCDGTSTSVDAINYVVSTIKNYSINSILKTADFTNSSYSLKIELLPADLDENGHIKKVLPDKNNIPAVNQYSTACLRITNNGSTGGFIAIIEFSPNGTLCPVEGVDETVRIESGNHYDLPVDKFDPPYGRYIMKGFITEHPIGDELSLVINQQGGARGMKDGIAGILGTMLDNPVGARNMQIRETPGSSASFSYQLLNQ